MYTEILYEVSDPVAVITLNRPGSLNAWTETMGHEVQHALRRADADPAVVGIVVTGAGRAFCAGADMKALAELSSGRPDPLAQADRTLPADAGDFGGRFPFLMALDKPVIAGVNGPVAGMAYPFALCCDVRVASSSAVFITAFAQRGLIAEWGLSWLLPRLVGPGVALDLLMTSRKVAADEALRIGLVNYLVGDDELLDFCRGYVTRLAESCSPASLAVIKRQVYEQLHRGLGEAEAESQRLMVASFGRPDFAEGVQSFLEKRPPRFARLGTAETPPPG